jgi:hypothetical protein
MMAKHDGAFRRTGGATKASAAGILAKATSVSLRWARRSSGATFTNKAVTYYEVDGIAIVEGDIALGKVQDIEADVREPRPGVG